MTLKCKIKEVTELKTDDEIHRYQDELKKAKEESEKGATVVCLVPARTDTRWWHNYCMKSAEVRFLTRRLTFEGAGNKATFPAAIVVFKPNRDQPVLKVQQDQ